ncbi:NAD(P)H-hydrate epimerase, partial [Christensenellaceae bacterium OttesenSCG-928-K19]|nr:NAD(P)H-hydrate epimerase [Christensenellaceae bacterium OttesenSCG-928-K19]
MRIVLDSKQMRAVDNYMINTNKIPGLLLMENAAMGICDAVMERTDPCTVHVICGMGNNGGDGLAAARILLTYGYDVYVVLAGTLENMTEDAARNYGLFSVLDRRTKHIQSIEDLMDWEIPEANVIVDALFGTGIAREAEGFYKALIEYINSQDAALVVGVDVPSGISADTGAVMDVAVRADITVTFQYPKMGHFLFPGREYCGELIVVPIGVDEGCEVLQEAKVCVYESQDEDICIGRRASNTNKGDYGRLMLIAGSKGMAGAAVLGARAATRVGAGLVTVGAGDDVLQVVQQAVPEATCKLLQDENGMLLKHSIFEIARAAKGKTAIAAGPGLGTSDEI